jgi:hypothetical protein
MSYEIDFILATEIMGLLGILVLFLFEKFQISSVIPESSGWIILGVLIGAVARFGIAKGNLDEAILLQFPVDAFIQICLPIIIFHAGWAVGNEKTSILLHNIFPILSLAVLGTLMSLLMTFAIVVPLVVTGNTLLGYKDLLVLSALLAATDPV